MTNQELREYNKNRRICQICVATTRDIEDILNEWVTKLKVGPWTVATLCNDTLAFGYWGDKEAVEPYKYICATAMYGDVQIEVVQPVYGKGMVDSFLARAGYGLQHFKEYVPDEKMDETVKYLESCGYAKTWWGGIKEDRFVNFDTESSLGFALEIGNFADIQLDEGTYYIYPRED